MIEYHDAFVSHLANYDKILYKVVMQNGPILLPESIPPFEHLIKIITGQQLSVKAAATIYSRVNDYLGQGYTPLDVLNTADEKLRKLGLSKSKTTYVKAVAEAAIENGSAFENLKDQSNDQVLKELTAIKGLGIWSAQMFLMFHMKRPDVFAPGDLGAKKAMSDLYGYSLVENEKFWDEKAIVWAPFRTLASLHLWKSLS